VVTETVEDDIPPIVLAVNKRTTGLLNYPQLDSSGQTKVSNYLVQGPKYAVVVNIRNNESAASERVDNVSSLLVNLDSVEVTWFSGHLDAIEISREFPDPPELDLEFSDDCRIVNEKETQDHRGLLTPGFPNS
jgi:hypothetical protein